MKLILKKRMLLKLLAIVFMTMVFVIGWFYLEYMFLARERSFDFDIYTSPSEIGIFQGDSINSTVIVLSNGNEYRPVEVYISNCPKYTVCALSISNAMPTFTSDMMLSVSDSTPAGNYPVNIIAVGGGVRKSITFYINVIAKECECAAWSNEGCGGMCGSQMYLARTCNPRRCDIESRCAYNSSCIADFSMESIPGYIRVFDQRADFTIRMRSLNNFSGYVYVSTDSCPMGSVCSYSLNPVFIPFGGLASSVLNIKTAVGTVFGDFSISTVGFSNDTIHSVFSNVTIA